MKAAWRRSAIRAAALISSEQECSSSSSSSVCCCCTTTPQHYCESCMIIIRVCANSLKREILSVNATIHSKMDYYYYYYPSVMIIIIIYAVMLMRLTLCTLLVLNRSSLLGISFFCPVSGDFVGFAPTPLYE